MGRSLLRWLIIGTSIGVAVGSFVGLGLSRFLNLPAVEGLTTTKLAAATEVRARDGSILATIASERRLPLPSDQIPALFRDAVIAAEDANFYHHPGIDPKGIARAVLRNLFSMRFSEGASTLTQQLARTLFLTPEKSIVRKIKEAFLAIEIEQRFSKDQILAMYANQVYFGHGVYGVEAASRFFFGKPASELSLPDAALLAGIIQRNIAQSPLRYPDRALARRDYVLRRMLEEGMIDKEQFDEARAAKLEVSPHFDRNPTAAYFIEEVRQDLEDEYGSQELLEGGLQVDTTLDPTLQQIGERAVTEGLVALQRRLGWPGARRNLRESGVADIAAWREPSWRYLRWEPDELAYAVVESVEPKQALLRIDERTAVLTLSGAAWTKRPSLLRLMQADDVLLVRLRTVPTDHDAPVEVELEPEPNVEGALVVLDNRTGAVLASVGGFDFDRSQWNRATQAARQCGSAFKPFVYLAAFERGMMPNDLIFDAPILLPDEHGDLTYSPLNYYRQFEGMVTLRYAVEHSLNVSAVKLQQMISGQAVVDVAHRLGISEPLAPYPSLALGSFEVTVTELASAYAGIANRGQWARPYSIARVRDGQGQTLMTRRPDVKQAVADDIAFLMTHVMEGVVRRGTATAATPLGAPLAGKTGTTDRYTDAWFIGYTPRITCAVWVGRDMKRPIGRNMTGAEAALPTWVEFMRGYLATQPEGVRTEPFPVPGNVVLVTVDPRTGLRATPACGDNVILEAVLEGREPDFCSPEWHDIIALPWQEQQLYYRYRPGEPITTPEAIAFAMAKIEEKGGEIVRN